MAVRSNIIFDPKIYVLNNRTVVVLLNKFLYKNRYKENQMDYKAFLTELAFYGVTCMLATCMLYISH